MAGRSASVGRTVAILALLGVLVIVLVTGAGYFVIRRIAVDRAIDGARQLTLLSSRVVEQRVSDGILKGDAFATGQVATVINDAVLHDPIVHVKLWGPDGTILYSDEPKAIGKKYASGAQELAELGKDETSAEISDLTAPENTYEEGSGPLLEVYTPIETPGGDKLLFETYQRYSSIDEQRQQLLRSFLPVLVIALFALALLLIPLGWILARRLQRSAREREEALQRSLDVSDRERRRIAGDLHDGPVQELAGLSMRLSASAESTADPAQQQVLRESATAVRGSVRTLRSAIVGVYPPNLEASGLGPALEDLTSRLRHEGLSVSLDVSDPAGYGSVVDQLLYRVCQEAVSNTVRHAGAKRLRIEAAVTETEAVLRVADDGRGLGSEFRPGVGLGSMRTRVESLHGHFRISPANPRGTLIEARLPRADREADAPR